MAGLTAMSVWRATKIRPRAPSSAGNANSTFRQVATIVHVKTGIRSMLMPGARRSTMVARIVPARTIALIAEAATPASHRSVPVPGEKVSLDMGRNSVQPSRGYPEAVSSEEKATAAPPTSIHIANRFSRGATRSAAPICSGTR